MKILVISPYLPHPKSGHGGGVLMYDFLKSVCERHEVSLISFVDDKEKTIASDLFALKLRLKLVYREKHLPENIISTVLLVLLRLFRLLQSILIWQPYAVTKYIHSGMARTIREETLSNYFDIVQIEYTQMGQYRRYVASGKTVLREHDLMFRTYYRRFSKTSSTIAKALHYVEWCRWAHYEPSLLRKFDYVFTLTEQDSRLCKRLYGISHVSCCPVGVSEQTRIAKYEDRHPHTLLFVGGFDHSPNIDAAEWLCCEIFPQLLERCSQAKLYLIGKNPPKTLLNLAYHFSSIQILGFVDRIEDYFNSCSVFIAPIRFGGGIKMKILTAQSYGIPVVTTHIGAEGIEGNDGESWFIGRSSSELVSKIMVLFDDRSKAAAMGDASVQNVAKHYSWRVLNEKIDRIYDSLVEKSNIKA